MSEKQIPKQDGGHKSVYPMRRRRTWLMVVLGLVILVSGVVIGSGATLLWLQRKLLYMIHHPENAPSTIAAHLRSRLDLTDEQVKRVEEVVRERQKSIQALRREVQPKAEAEIEKVRVQVEQILTPDQAKKWNAYFVTMKGRWLPPPPGTPTEKGGPPDGNDP